MSNIKISEDFISLVELKSKASATLKRLSESDRPIVVTQHGKPAGVLLNPKEYDRLTERDHLVLAIEEGLEDVKAGRTVADDTLWRRLEERFGSLDS